MICILVLINQNVPEFILIFIKYIRMFAKQLNRFNQKIIKIHGVGLLKSQLIPLVNLGRNIIKCAVYKPVLIHFGHDQLIFCIADFSLYGAWFNLFWVKIEFFQN